MKRILWLSSIATLAIFAPAFAADNVSVKDATGATVSTASKDVSGVHFRKDICVTLADTTIDCFTELNASLRAEDTASGDADSGLPIFAVRKATPANTSGTDGDYEALQISAGRLWTDAGALLPTSLGAKVGTGSLSVVPASDGFGVNATQTGTWNITNVSGTVSLPTGAATAAKQPALGTAGSSSADVITVQGIASGTNLNVNCQVGCSGGTAYTEDVAAASDPVGLAVISRRRDTLSASEVSADGDNIGLVSTSKGELRINDNSLNTAFGTASDAASTSGSSSAQGYFRSMRDDLRTLATDTSPLSTYGFAGTATTSFARPADTTAYTANDIISDSTSAPTSGGFTLSNMCRTSGGSGIITDLYMLSNDTAALAGKVLIYDSSVTAVNDNAAENLSDADAAKLVGEVPFTLAAKANNAGHNVQNLNLGYTCNGTTNLRFLLQATGGTLTTASANTYTLRVKFVQTN